MQDTTTIRRGPLLALLCAVAFAAALVMAIGAVAQDAPAAATQAPATTQLVQDAQEPESQPDSAPDRRDCPEKDGRGGGDAPQAGGTADDAGSAGSTAL